MIDGMGMWSWSRRAHGGSDGPGAVCLVVCRMVVSGFVELAIFSEDAVVGMEEPSVLTSRRMEPPVRGSKPRHPP